MAATKMRWGDSLDEDLGDDLPADSVVGPDAKGVKIVTQYKKNDKGDTVKTVIKTKFTKVERKVYKVPSSVAQQLYVAETRVPRLNPSHSFKLLLAVSNRAKRMEEIWGCCGSAARAQCHCTVTRRCAI